MVKFGPEGGNFPDIHDSLGNSDGSKSYLSFEELKNLWGSDKGKHIIEKYSFDEKGTENTFVDNAPDFGEIYKGLSAADIQKNFDLGLGALREISKGRESENYISMKTKNGEISGGTERLTGNFGKRGMISGRKELVYRQNPNLNTTFMGEFDPENDTLISGSIKSRVPTGYGYDEYAIVGTEDPNAPGKFIGKKVFIGPFDNEGNPLQKIIDSKGDIVAKKEEDMGIFDAESGDILWSPDAKKNRLLAKNAKYNGMIEWFNGKFKELNNEIASTYGASGQAMLKKARAKSAEIDRIRAEQNNYGMSPEYYPSGDSKPDEYTA